jgi:arabinose-5-phosphate isomerase
MSPQLDFARQLVRYQAVALSAVSDALDERFDAAVSKILSAPGKVVVSGMGKAGLIGQKISATLRSTGQPSAFLDPAQALHGDMGMLAFGDVLLGLSNSGETSELMTVARYCAEHAIPVIAITTAQLSELSIEADVSIEYPKLAEGCPIGRAPMASSTMMLAIGDALAGALMRLRGFTEQDFLALHHGGYLGRAIAANQ